MVPAGVHDISWLHLRYLPVCHAAGVLARQLHHELNSVRRASAIWNRQRNSAAAQYTERASATRSVELAKHLPPANENGSFRIDESRIEYATFAVVVKEIF
jgi:hypothetical protein